MGKLCKNKTGRQVIAERLEIFVSFPVNQPVPRNVHYFSNFKLAPYPSGAYIPHSFYNE
jgi:hypothetical protein